MKIDKEIEVVGENQPQFHFVYHKSHKTWPGIEPVPPQWKPAANNILRLGTTVLLSFALSSTMVAIVSKVPGPRSGIYNWNIPPRNENTCLSSVRFCIFQIMV
jgi:hypothetical protein